MTKARLGTALLSLSLSAAASAQNYRWSSLKTRKLITFDFNCARTDSFPNAALSKIVQSAIKLEDRGSGTYGDRAFPIILQKHGAPIYFVPTVCGATGNCTWRVYTINPLKYLGELNGLYIYTHGVKANKAISGVAKMPARAATLFHSIVGLLVLHNREPVATG